jgi:hypothetical protein
MDWDDLGDWVVWSVLAFAFLCTAVVTIMSLAVGARAAIRYLRACFSNSRRGRGRGRGRGGSGNGNGNGKGKTPPVFIEDLLASIPEVAYGYKELPSGPPPAAGVGGGDRDDDGSGGRESCAICVTPFEAGEPCSVLPGCDHMFHRPCVAKWLRQRSTCPLCRANVVVGLSCVRSSSSSDNLNAAENMV